MNEWFVFGKKCPVTKKQLFSLAPTEAGGQIFSGYVKPIHKKIICENFFPLGEKEKCHYPHFPSRPKPTIIKLIRKEPS